MVSRSRIHETFGRRERGKGEKVVLIRSSGRQAGRQAGRPRHTQGDPSETQNPKPIYRVRPFSPSQRTHPPLPPSSLGLCTAAAVSHHHHLPAPVRLPACPPSRKNRRRSFLRQKSLVAAAASAAATSTDHVRPGQEGASFSPI